MTDDTKNEPGFATDKDGRHVRLRVRPMSVRHDVGLGGTHAHRAIMVDEDFVDTNPVVRQRPVPEPFSDADTFPTNAPMPEGAAGRVRWIRNTVGYKEMSEHEAMSRVHRHMIVGTNLALVARELSCSISTIKRIKERVKKRISSTPGAFDGKTVVAKTLAEFEELKKVGFGMVFGGQNPRERAYGTRIVLAVHDTMMNYYQIVGLAKHLDVGDLPQAGGHVSEAISLVSDLRAAFNDDENVTDGVFTEFDGPPVNDEP